MSNYELLYDDTGAFVGLREHQTTHSPASLAALASLLRQTEAALKEAALMATGYRAQLEEAMQDRDSISTLLLGANENMLVLEAERDALVRERDGLRLALVATSEAADRVLADRLKLSAQVAAQHLALEEADEVINGGNPPGAEDSFNKLSKDMYSERSALVDALLSAAAGLPKAVRVLRGLLYDDGSTDAVKDADRMLHGLERAVEALYAAGYTGEPPAAPTDRDTLARDLEICRADRSALAAARAWVRQHGQHPPSCGAARGERCTCGLDELRGAA